MEGRTRGGRLGPPAKCWPAWLGSCILPGVNPPGSPRQTRQPVMTELLCAVILSYLREHSLTFHAGYVSPAIPRQPRQPPGTPGVTPGNSPAAGKIIFSGKGRKRNGKNPRN